VTPGQTVTFDNTPIVIRTSAGKTEVVVAGTKTVALTTPNAPDPFFPAMTEGPLLSPITIGGETITANSASQYIISGQTLHPGGPAITVSGTTISLLPSATAVIINGVTSTLSQVYGAVITTTTAPFLTLNNKVYTANRAGNYVLAPGTTLTPGGAPVTVSGTVISVGEEGTAAVIQGSTSFMRPLTTVVTLTRGHNGYGAGGALTADVPGGLPQATGTGKHNSAGVVRVSASFVVADGFLGGFLLFGMVGLGWLAVSL
jgi:hypothetical protein